MEAAAAIPCSLFLLMLAACTPPPATAPAAPPAAASSSPAPILPAESPPLLLEYIVLRRAWVEHVLPVPPEAAATDASEEAYRRAKAPELAAKLAAELTTRLRSGAPARVVLADAVNAVLGERAAEDAARPTARVVLRAGLDQVHLPAAAKAALVTFARSAHAGDVLPAPAVDGATIVVARARAPSSE